jgi:hypothetical protein
MLKLARPRGIDEVRIRTLSLQKLTCTDGRTAQEVGVGAQK